jgi:hypothetical protein
MARASDYPFGPLPRAYKLFFAGPFRSFCLEILCVSLPSPKTFEDARREIARLALFQDPLDWTFGSIGEALRTQGNLARAALRDARDAIGTKLQRDQRPSRYERDVFDAV